MMTARHKITEESCSTMAVRASAISRSQMFTALTGSKDARPKLQTLWVCCSQNWLYLRCTVVLGHPRTPEFYICVTRRLDQAVAWCRLIETRQLPMLLLDLPPECLIHISTFLHSLRDLNSFIQAGKPVFSLLGRDLYRRDGRVADTLQWAALRRVTGTILRASSAGIHLSKYPSFLYILAAQGHAIFLNDILSRSPDLRAVIDSDHLQLGPPLGAAIASASINTVRVLVKHGADVNHPHGLTPLGEAVLRYRDAPVILYMLLLHGADPNRAGGFGCTPLYAAVQNRDVSPSLVQLLLNCGAAAGAIGETDSMATPLHAACRVGAVEAARILLDNGADVNAATSSGLVPLHFSVAVGSTFLALELLERGADPNVPDDNGWRPLALAINNKCIEMTEILLLYGACVCQHGALLSPLKLAIQNQDLDIIDLVVAAGPDVWQLDEADIEIALESRRHHLLELLLSLLGRQHYQQPSVQAAHYATAVGGDYMLMADDFLDLGPEPSAFDAADYSALHLAAFHGRKDFVSSLLEGGAKPDGTGRLTPLQVAAWAGNATIVRQLIQHGAGIRKKSVSGLSAIGGAAIEGYAAIVQMLLDNGANLECADVHGDTPLHMAAKFGNVQVMKALLKRGADLHAKNVAGQTAVDLSWNQPCVIDWLKQTAGVDLNGRNERGETLLSMAASGGHALSIEALFDDEPCNEYGTRDWFHPGNSARLLGNIPDSSGNLPIFAALESGNWEAIWRLLVVDDEILKMENREGKTVIARAMQIGNDNLIRHLLGYAMKNGLEIAWGSSAAANDTSTLCNVCKYHIPYTLPAGSIYPGRQIWTSGCFVEQERKVFCYIQGGIHTWETAPL